MSSLIESNNTITLSTENFLMRQKRKIFHLLKNFGQTLSIYSAANSMKIGRIFCPKKTKKVDNHNGKST